jgi:hypothetical protein
MIALLSPNFPSKFHFTGGNTAITGLQFGATHKPSNALSMVFVTSLPHLRMEVIKEFLVTVEKILENEITL